ncbi:NAD(P)H-binding protein [Sulfitobacter pontiacus]|uniref:NAD(P)H-binding protein n=1 Tax=Sulfitobacter pontiacus TaxID=60137 RepID=UPI00276B94E8|nr:NAD(P)H-binding protein [Sulfitobacter pontiacus]GLO80004.1 saccharopine dehydrogenase [Sulfitobacter pontiacus]
MSDAETNISRKIAVYGANGHTGRLVVSELLKRGVSPIAVARSSEAISAAQFPGEVTRRCATVDDPLSLDTAFEGAAAVINCAGAFLDTANAIAGAAVRKRLHYLDVTAEQASAQKTFETFDSSAREAGVVVLPAMGFFGGFADLLATVATKGWASVDDINVMIGLDSWHPTRGTRLTGERNTARRLVVEKGALVPVQLPPAEGEGTFVQPVGHQRTLEVPLSEIILISRHLKPKAVRTFLSANAIEDIRDTSTPVPRLDETGRSPQRFVVEIVARLGQEERRVVAQGRDIYAFSAPLVCEAVGRLLRPEFNRAGAYTPGQIFDAADLLNALRSEHFTLNVLED